MSKTIRMEEKMIENAYGGQLVYMPYKKGIAIKRYHGIAQRVIVPPEIEGKAVTAIERKAFLSCKTVRFISLPDTIEEIGDWAFAHAEQLSSVTIPRHQLSRGKELFLGCKRLKEIVLNSSQEEWSEYAPQGLYRMLAMAVTVLHDYFLFDPFDFGNDEWVKRWDEKLMVLVELDDLDGFEELWTCGEEDYEGKDYDIKSYPVEKRKMKLRIVYFRLMHPYKISQDTLDALREYLYRHTKGTDTPEAWELIMEEHQNDLKYYRVFADSGCITEDNFDSLLEDMKDCTAEIKAYLLRYKEEHFATKDAFAAFDLNW
ncbi:MAG: leucine-rich repeat domain-containing protein [Lachnospiraceae bacterium]|nr:leucine-rich repeat domain-containing protein [Lachnospiraceae bacterium]MDE7204239.1 leucine-rich repeat domain-containing protein [Lachnospiraceae bacterium]